jgi:hypothetical protein
MISERQLSTCFDSFWQHHFPLLNPTFVRRFNAEQRERLLRSDGSPLLSIPMGKEVERFDVVAEMAFEAARENYRKRKGEVPDPAKAIERALSKIALIRGESGLASLSRAESTEAEALAAAYEDLFDSIADQGEVRFRRRIKGAGILDQTEADFCTTSTLFEVKAVNRNLQSGDLRQVMCYLVAGLGSREYSWTDYCIFNPRLAVTYSGKVEELLAYLSGRTSHECIADVLDALMEREQPLEAKF